MKWKECLDKQIITKIAPDKERSKEILEMANLRLKFWEKDIESEFTSLKIEAYYEIIKELILAHLYKNGFYCTNHLCLIAYLNKYITNFDFEITKIDELRQLRNQISYRGFKIGKDYLKRNELEFKHIINRLKME